MSRPVFLPCADGSDAQCFGFVEAEYYSPSYYKLSDKQQEQVGDIAKNYTKDDGDLKEEIDGVLVEIWPAVCGACGSEYTRNDDGNIID